MAVVQWLRKFLQHVLAPELWEGRGGPEPVRLRVTPLEPRWVLNGSPLSQALPTPLGQAPASSNPPSVAASQILVVQAPDTPSAQPGSATAGHWWFPREAAWFSRGLTGTTPW